MWLPIALNSMYQSLGSFYIQVAKVGPMRGFGKVQLERPARGSRINVLVWMRRWCDLGLVDVGGSRWNARRRCGGIGVGSSRDYRITSTVVICGTLI